MPSDAASLHPSISHAAGAVRSPCIRQCCLDDDGICIGCFRSVQEIQEWSVVADRRRYAILQNADRRREAKSGD